MLERIIHNWKTTSAVVVALVIAACAWTGTDVDPGTITKLLAGAYGILLLFAKD